MRLRNYIFIGIGTVSLYLILLLFSYSIESEQGNVLIDNKILQPTESTTATKIIKAANQRMQLVVHYPLFAASINARVLDPSGNEILNVNSTSYDKELYSEFLSGVSGNYNIVLTNHGDQSIPIHVILGNIENSS